MTGVKGIEKLPTNLPCVTGTWLVTSGWTQVNCTFTTGSSVSGSTIYVRQTDATSRDFWVDGFRLEQGTSLTSYGAGKKT